MAAGVHLASTRPWHPTLPAACGDSQSRSRPRRRRRARGRVRAFALLLRSTCALGRGSLLRSDLASEVTTTRAANGVRFSLRRHRAPMAGFGSNGTADRRSRPVSVPMEPQIVDRGRFQFQWNRRSSIAAGFSSKWNRRSSIAAGFSSNGTADRRSRPVSVLKEPKIDTDGRFSVLLEPIWSIRWSFSVPTEPGSAVDARSRFVENFARMCAGAHRRLADCDGREQASRAWPDCGGGCAL